MGNGTIMERQEMRIKMDNDKNIMLIGFMGTGKSAVSRELAKITGKKEIDMDAYIEEKEGCSINEIFGSRGEEYFRERETKHLIDIQKETGLIVSCGGGTVLKAENVRHMKEGGIVVWLTAAPESVYERVKDSDDRPLLNGNMNVEFIAGLMSKREDKYRAAADIEVATDGRDIADIAREILEEINCKRD